MNKDKQVVIDTMNAAARLHGLPTYSELVAALRKQDGWLSSSAVQAEARTLLARIPAT